MCLSYLLSYFAPSKIITSSYMTPNQMTLEEFNDLCNLQNDYDFLIRNLEQNDDYSMKIIQDQNRYELMKPFLIHQQNNDYLMASLQEQDYNAEESGDTINTCDCSHQAHIECIDQWHNIEYGRIIRQGRLSCPQCKSPGKSIKFFKNDKDIIDTLDVLNKNPEWSYIFCPSCKDLKQYVKESCANYIDTKYRLICDNCSPSSFRTCPKCDVMIERFGGCVHMKCGNCKTDFCWICLEIYNKNNIYDHIDRVHRNNTEFDLQYQDYYDRINDRLISIGDVPQGYLTEEIIKLSLEFDPKALLYIDQTREICLKVIKNHWYALEYVKEQDREMCLIAINKDCRALQYVRKQDRKMCMIAIKQDCHTLQYVKEQDREMCLIAVKEDYNTLKYVKDQIREICLAAINNHYRALQYVKEQDREMCLEAIKRNSYALQYVKEQDREMCLIAIQQCEYALDYVIEQDREMCLIAVSKNYNAFQYVKEQDEEMCLIAVKQNGHTIRYVKDQTLKICLAAIENNECALKYVREQTKEICLIAMKISRYVYSYVKNEDHINNEYQDFFLENFRKNHDMLRFIINKTENIYLIVVKDDGLALKFVENQTEKICIAAIKQNCHSFQYVKNKTTEICLFALEINAQLLQYIDDQTLDICLIAVRSNKKALKYVKPEFLDSVKNKLSLKN